MDLMKTMSSSRQAQIQNCMETVTGALRNAKSGLFGLDRQAKAEVERKRSKAHIYWYLWPPGWTKHAVTFLSRQWYNKNRIAIHRLLFKACLKRVKGNAILGILRLIHQYLAPALLAGDWEEAGGTFQQSFHQRYTRCHSESDTELRPCNCG